MKKFVVILLLACCLTAQAQVKFSFATDVSGMRNFSPQQKFWSIGHTLQGNFHLSKKETVYAWLMYFTPGRFENRFAATAKSSSTAPAIFPYAMKGLWNMKQVSIGLKHYFKGSFDAEKEWNLYGLAGFGLLFNGVENTLLTSVDTTLYTLAPTPVEGNGNFRRLTLDLGMGAEIPLGGDFFVYGDVRTVLPTSSYPSPYLHRLDDVPMPVLVNLGVRILFSINY